MVTFTKIYNSDNMFLSFNGGRISYGDTGEGYPLVLIHGYLETSEVWQEFEGELPGRFRVITPDLPGHGGSDSFGPVHTMEFMASAIKELLDKLGIETAFVAGHSLGGYVTLAFLDLYPDYLSGYCLFHSHPFPDTAETISKRKGEIALVNEGRKGEFYQASVTKMFADRNLGEFTAELQRSIDIASGISDEGIIAVLNGMMARPSRLVVMEEGRVPCLWLLGELDNYIPAQAMAKRVVLPSNSRVVVLKESGHMGFVEQKKLSAKLLDNFISGLE